MPLILVAALLATAAPARVVIVDNGIDDALVRESMVRLRAELIAAGFAPITETMASPATGTAIETLADARHAVAAFSLRRDDNQTIAVVLADRYTKKIVQRSFGSDSGPLTGRVVALRAVELLHASVLELAVTPEADVSQRPAVIDDALADLRGRAPIDASAGRTIGAGLVMLTSVQGLGTALAPALSMGAALGARLGVRATLVWPTGTASYRSDAGEARVRQELLAFDLVLPWRAPGWRVVPALTGGLGAYHLAVTGNASSPFAGQSDDAWAITASVGGELALRAGRFALIAGVGVAVLLPSPAVDVGGVIVGRTGRPALLSRIQVACGF